MEKEFTKTYDYKITEDQLADLLSMASDYCVGFDYWDHHDSIDGDTKENYASAKKSLIDEGINKDDICLETVWARMLFQGKPLFLLEADTEEDWHTLTLDKIITGLSQYFTELPCTGCTSIDGILQDGDAYDADAVFQYAIYGEIIYG